MSNRAKFYSEIAKAAYSRVFVTTTASGEEIYEDVSPKGGRLDGIFTAAIRNGYRLNSDEQRFGMVAGNLRRRFFPAGA